MAVFSLQKLSIEVLRENLILHLKVKFVKKVSLSSIGSFLLRKESSELEGSMVFRSA